MKKIFTLALLLSLVTSLKAQFEQDTYYINTSLTNFDLSYSGAEKTRFGVQANGGYFVDDDIAVIGTIGADIRNNSFREFDLGLGGRYYIEQNGIFLGLGAQFVHGRSADEAHYNDIMPYGEIGYAFFINKSVTVEPSLYYRQSLKDHSEFSKIGLKIGFGLYF